MKLYFNDMEMPVIWEENETVKEIRKELEKGDIIVQLKVYNNSEQVGLLGKNYISDDKIIEATCGDIVLYSKNYIVVFYGKNL